MPIGKRTFQSAGQISQHLIPGAFSRIDSIKGQGGLVSVNNGVIMGQCTGGEPATLLQFNNVAEAVRALRGGALMEAVRLAFNPGDDLIPQRLFAMRVNASTQGKVNLADGVTPTPMIKVTSKDYGLWTNQITIQIENATVLVALAKKVTVRYQSQPAEVFDEVRRQSFEIEYTGGACTMTIVSHVTTKTLTTSAGAFNGAPITLTDYPTIGELAAFINAATDYTCTAIAGQEDASSSELDGVSGLDINASAKTVESTLQAIADTIKNGSAWATACPADPYSITLATFLVGGTIVINGLTFTAHVDTTTVANREFDISGSDTADALELLTCINDATYGVPNVTATQVAGEVLLVADDSATTSITVTSNPDDGTCTKVGVTRTIPPNVGPLYLSSGAEGSYGANQWTAALLALEAEDVQFVSTPDSSASVHASIKTHCESMSSVTGRKERQFLVGSAWGATVAAATAAAITLNSKWGLYTFNGFTHYDVNSHIQNYSASYFACMLLAMKCASAINAPLTFNKMNVISLKDKLTDSELETLIENGVCPFNYDTAGLPHCVRQVNSYQTDDLKWNEFSMVTEMGFVSRDLRAYLESLFVGKAGTFLVDGVLKGAAENKLAQYEDLGVFIVGEEGVSWWNVQIVISGDVVYIDYDVFLTAPVNFMFVTQHFHEMVRTV